MSLKSDRLELGFSIHMDQCMVSYTHQKSPCSAQADLSRGLESFTFGMSLHIQPSLVHVSNEGPGESAHMCRLA